MFKPLLSFLMIATSAVLLSGCTTFGAITNIKKNIEEDNIKVDSHSQTPFLKPYSIQSVMSQKPLGRATLILAFSGGGSRAAALAYGVLEELRDTPIQRNGKTIRMLDEVDVISSVSGGSFIAAYYGLHGEKTFDKFEKLFLRRNIEELLIEQALNPFMWFSQNTRTDRAVEFYEEAVFKGATFADLHKQNGPLIVINASELGNGVRFSFTQEYFDLLCSDLNDFPLARAVTASSSVPVVFNPVVLKKYRHCDTQTPSMLLNNRLNNYKSYELSTLQRSLRQYINPNDKRDYLHLVDGGITDNLGLRAIYDVMELSGGPRVLLEKFKQEPVGHFAVISVNASTQSTADIGMSNQVPTIETTIRAVSDIQLHRYNAATIELFQQGLKRWSQALSTKEKPVSDYFIEVSFKDLVEPERRAFFNRIPTSFSLNKEEADELIETGRYLLKNHPLYKKLITNLGKAED